MSKSCEVCGDGGRRKIGSFKRRDYGRLVHVFNISRVTPAGGETVTKASFCHHFRGVDYGYESVPVQVSMKGAADG